MAMKKIVLLIVIIACIVSVVKADLVDMIEDPFNLTERITLDDGSKIIKSFDNKSMIIEKKGKKIFNITSSTPYNFIGDFAKTKEWGYEKAGYENIECVGGCWLYDSDTICPNEIINSTQFSKSYSCVYYTPDKRINISVIDGKGIVYFEDGYDPEIVITDVSTGVFNQTFHNSSVSGVQINTSGSFTSGAYIGTVQNLSSDGTIQAVNNISYSCDEPAGTNCSVSVRTNPLDLNPAFWYCGEDTEDGVSSLRDCAGKENNLGIPAGSSVVTNSNCFFEQCIYHADESSSTSGSTITNVDLTNGFTFCWHVIWTQQFFGNDQLWMVLRNATGNDNIVWVRTDHGASYDQIRVLGSDNLNYNSDHSVKNFQCIRYNITGISFWENGASVTSGNAVAIATHESNLEFRVQERTHYIDDMLLFNYSLSDQNMTDLYNSLRNWTDFTERNYTNPTLFTNNNINGSYAQSKFYLETNSTSQTPTLYNYSTGYSTISEPPPAGDTTNPTITLISPANNSNFTISNIDFSANVTDDIMVANVSLYINGTLNQTNSTGGNATYNFNLTLADGDWLWLIEAFDNSSNAVNSSERILHIDTTIPSFTIPPENDSTTNISSGINWTNNEDTNLTIDYGECPLYNESNISNSTPATFHNPILTGLTNFTNYCLNITVWDPFGNTNFTLFNFTTAQNVACAPNWLNTSWIYNYTVECYINDTNNDSYYRIEYDNNTCAGSTNTTYYTNIFNDTCDYCSYNVVNTSLIFNLTLDCMINDTNNDSYYKIEYDDNYSTCYAITNISTDLWNNGTNNTYTEYLYNDTCDYCSYNVVNTSLIFNLTLDCMINDTNNDSYYKIEYDDNYSTCYAITNISTDLWNNGTNNTYTEYLYNDTCDYCSYNVVNTSLIFNLTLDCMINDTNNDSYYKIEYDDNYSTCYAITNISTDLWNNGSNNTYTEYLYNDTCDYCSYNVVNTSLIFNLTLDCMINDTNNDSYYKIEYDDNYSTCYAITNISTDLWNNGTNNTYTEYLYNDTCDYCSYNVVNTSWFFAYNNTCYLNDTMNQTYNRTEYDSNFSTCYGVTGLPSDLWNNGTNNTYSMDVFNESCNYCSYNVANISTGWVNITCLGNSTMNQSNTTTEYDSNFSTCYGITGLPSDLWNNGTNNTYIEYRDFGSCVYAPFCPSFILRNYDSGQDVFSVDCDGIVNATNDFNLDRLIFKLGVIIDNLLDGLLTITGNLRVTGNTNTTFLYVDTIYFNSGGNITSNGTCIITSIGPESTEVCI